MKWKPVITTLAVLAVGGVGYAAYRFFSREKDLLEDYEIEPVGFSLLKATETECIIKFTLRLTNKSSIEAEMKKLYSDVYLNQIYVGYVINDTPAVIPAKGTGDINLQFSFNPKVILKSAVDLILQVATTKDISYRMKGYVDLKSGFIPVSVPFEDSGKLSDFI